MNLRNEKKYIIDSKENGLDNSFYSICNLLKEINLFDYEYVIRTIYNYNTPFVNSYKELIEWFLLIQKKNLIQEKDDKIEIILVKSKKLFYPILRVKKK